MTETRACQNCREKFVIEPEDFDFYKKIDVPPPTWCPECRAVRRMLWRNERALYSGICDLCKKKIISVHPPDRAWPVYCISCWWSDNWDPMQYGRDFDEKRPLLEQFAELLLAVPRQNIVHRNAVNAEYANAVAESKNVYLSYSILGSEDVYYSKNIDKSLNIVDSFDVQKSELCYEVVNSHNIYNSAFIIDSNDCLDSRFLYDCANCRHCFMCSGLRNKEYHIDNRVYTKEEYEKTVATYDFGGSAWMSGQKRKFSDLKKSSLRKYANVLKSTNSTGDNIQNCKNVRAIFNAYNMEDSKFVVRSFFSKDCYDVLNGGPNNELFYEFAIGGSPNGQQVKFVVNGLLTLTDAQYSNSCMSSSNLFACVGLRNKQYCILNKQYSKSEYESLILKIIEHMNTTPYVDAKGRAYRYGEFFPPELSPFCYNETIAQEYFPLTKEQALERGLRWKEPEQRTYHITRVAADIPDHIAEVQDEIMNEVIGCAHSTASTPSISSGQASSPHASSWPSQSFGGQAGQAQCNEQCTTAFKIIEPELQFYRRMNLPLPRLCPNCRHYERLRQRNPLKLWHRMCRCQTSDVGYRNTAAHFHGKNHCPNEFETSYAPDRPEVVYCEQCYQAEVS